MAMEELRTSSLDRDLNGLFTRLEVLSRLGFILIQWIPFSPFLGFFNGLLLTIVFVFKVLCDLLTGDRI